VSHSSGNNGPPPGWYDDAQSPGRERWWDGVVWTEHRRAGTSILRNAPGQQVAASPRACPACGAEDLKTLRAIHAQGTTTGSSSSSGWVQGNGNQPGNLVTVRSSSRNQTETAREAAPPRKRFNGVALVIFGVVFGSALGWLGYQLGTNHVAGSAQINVVLAGFVGAILVVIGAVVGARNSAYNRDAFDHAYARWDRSWQCQRCGRVTVF
jgi:Protein of unknown function (DUF2510)